MNNLVEQQAVKFDSALVDAISRFFVEYNKFTRENASRFGFRRRAYSDHYDSKKRHGEWES